MQARRAFASLIAAVVAAVLLAPPLGAVGDPGHVGEAAARGPAAQAVTSAAAVPLIVNGDFEAGSLAGWTSAGTTFVVTTAHAGYYAARLGGSSWAPSGDSTIVQSFTVPAGGGTLSFWYRVSCQESVSETGQR